MLEAYTTLGFLAGAHRAGRLHTLVTGVVYREPGLLAKVVTTLDVLSGGRAGLGIGAAWNEEEARGPGSSVPADWPSASSASRRRCRSACRCGARMRRPTTGGTTSWRRTLNSPQAAQRPHPPILIGGGGERKTLRLVAQYADACNLFAGADEAAHKLDVLRAHCERVGRDYDEIEKTTMINIDASTSQGELLDKLRAGHDLGFTTTYVFARNPEPLAAIELLAGVAGEIARLVAPVCPRPGARFTAADVTRLRFRRLAAWLRGR